MGEENNGHWILDKRVPVALIFALALQTVAIIWWAATMENRVNALEKSVSRVEPHADRLTRLEVRLDGVMTGIGEIKQLMRKDQALDGR